MDNNIVNGDGDKKVTISGTNNRYMIKKVTRGKESPKIRKEAESKEWNSNKETQLNLLQDVCSGIFSQEIHRDLQKQLERKLASYKQQDILKKKWSESEFVNMSQLIDLLIESKLSCYYCSKDVLLLYEVVREPYQWTLDRINNEIGHNSGNLLVSCLECNLNRRKKSKDAFLFTKKLIITRSED
jgi:hypothetical protein